MKNNELNGRGYDLDYYALYLRQYLKDHRFPEWEDDLLIEAKAEQATDTFVASRLAGDEYVISSEKALATLLDGFEMSNYEFIQEILLEEFIDDIPLDDRSLEFWTYTMLEELAPEFKGMTLSKEYLATNEGAVFKLTVIGRISLYLEENGL